MVVGIPGVRRAFRVEGGALIELAPPEWQDPRTGAPLFQLATKNGEMTPRFYPYRLPTGELVAIYAERAEDVVAAVADGNGAAAAADKRK